jgi:tRNA (cytidine/uridine-2'-O-)-methyltransferase
MNVVLFEPEIPWNTGSIGRTCVATGSTLHLVEPLGFQISSKEIRRSGLDYWPRLRLVRHQSVEAFMKSLPADASVIAFSTKGRRSFRRAPYRPDSYLFFGRESSGLPAPILSRFKDCLVRIPVSSDVRSLNLSVAAAVAIYEAIGRIGGDHAINPQIECGN